jgi:septal ring-binding cell division protein DamX
MAHYATYNLAVNASSSFPASVAALGPRGRPLRSVRNEQWWTLDGLNKTEEEV